MNLHKMSREELIKRINILGPWSHGYFDLGNGLVIEDQDLIQKKRLFFYRDYFIDIIRNYYQKETLSNKTLCEIGCNTGYFLFELFKKFKFRRITGLEPRKSNLAKARFIARYFRLSSKKYELKKFDILTKSNKLPYYDIVIMPSILHHIDNHLIALSNAYKMTHEICIIDSLVLPDELNTQDIAQKLELKDDLYKEIKKDFGIIGYKIESNKLDGAAYHSGIVGIPTIQALIMMLYHVGFSDVKIYRNSEQLKKEVYNGRLYRDINAVIVIASKKKDKRKAMPDYNNILRNIQIQEFNTFVPMDIILPCYKRINGIDPEERLSSLSRLIYESAVYFRENRREKVSNEIAKKLRNKNLYSIIQTFKHAPQHKITFEYAKTCYHKGLLEKAEDAAAKLIKTGNLDWRTVYKTYYLLAMINFKKKNKEKAAEYNKLSLRAFESYFPALELKKKLG